MSRAEHMFGWRSVTGYPAAHYHRPMAVEHAHALIDAVCGQPDMAATRAVEVLSAQGAALAWVGQATGSYPASAGVAARLREMAEELKDPSDHRDPDAVLIQVAAVALAEERSSTA